ncbi:ABC transporter permease [Bacillus spizizenii]|uniref:ABC-2 type transporter family n=1 Tax=Bacillus spizizenii (strain DSM 15029 / JCM 12233 / NBRC 101239 / NRRL B-23049 / TU-B-10) TaxID=1052585 RepID=G4NUJ2_BACS4|nr:ABC transporter permease [Bacillus spizizenii]AEP85778.1 ABC-2 type transporter family [Bacillus spizizenii TU-B-10]GEK26145.1 putative transport permease YfiN [Bacillus spizizenii]
MKKIIAICGIELSLIFKKRQNYLMMFAAPLLLTFVFGSMLGSNDDKLRLAIVDQDDTILSQHYIRQLKAHDGMYTFENMSESKASEKLKQKKIAGIIVISHSFQAQLEKGKNPELIFRHGPELSEAPMAKQYAESTLAKLNIQVSAAKTVAQAAGENWKAAYKTVIAKDHEDAAPVVKQKALSDKKEGASDTASRAAGFSILFVMLTMMGAAGTILEARKNGVWSRLLTAPVSRMEIGAGYVLSFFVIGWIQFGILLLASHWLFGINWGNPAAVIVLVSFFLLTVVGIGLVIAANVRTPEQQLAFGNLFVIATCMVSGMYWPIDIEPKFMQSIAEFLPQKWAMSGLTEIMANGAHVTDILGICGILLVFVAITFTVGLKALRA